MEAENSTVYLYGKGVIGTKTDSWGYILQDGLGSTRQLATHEGVIAMSVAYTPWGDVLEYYGSGGIGFGYLGGMYDDTTGLIYLGSGQYYDPVTGRMLTRGAEQSNPYKPGAFDPAGMMVAPLAMLGLVLGKKKKRGKWDTFIALLAVCVVAGMSVSACSKPLDENALRATALVEVEKTMSVQLTITAIADEMFAEATEEKKIAETNEAPAHTPTPTCPPTLTPTPTLTLTPTLHYVGEFNLSGYYTTHESQKTWVGGNKLVKSNSTKVGLGKYLSKYGGYTNNENEALEPIRKLN
ncbi:MAG: hypothetical protein ACT6FC_04740 [Methanosarcinaceae archaeon]